MKLTKKDIHSVGHTTSWGNADGIIGGTTTEVPYIRLSRFREFVKELKEDVHTRLLHHDNLSIRWCEKQGVIDLIDELCGGVLE